MASNCDPCGIGHSTLTPEEAQLAELKLLCSIYNALVGGTNVNLGSEDPSQFVSLKPFTTTPGSTATVLKIPGIGTFAKVNYRIQFLSNCETATITSVSRDQIKITPATVNNIGEGYRFYLLKEAIPPSGPIHIATDAYQAGVWNVTVSGPITVGTVDQGTGGASPWLISGSVSATQSGGWIITSITNPVAVTGTFWQATQPISGTVTVTPNPLPVSQSGTWNIGTITSITNPVTVTGTVTATVPNPLPVSQSGTWNINDISGTISLPTGAATEVTLATLNAKFGSIGQQLMAASAPVVIASDQSAIPITGSVTATVPNPLPVSQSGTWNINDISGTISLPTGAATEATLATLLTTTAFQARINTLGQKTMANSTPVVLASDQTVIPVSQSGNWLVRLQDGSGNSISSTAGALDVNVASGITLTVDLDYTTDSVTVYGSEGVPLQQKAATNDLIVTLDSEVVAASQSGTWNINNISGTVSLPTGAATEATLGTLLTTSAFQARINTLGQKTMANSTPVVLASDQTVIPVSQSGTWNIGTVTTLTSITNPVAVTQSGTWNINNISGTISLPTGAATESTLSTLNAKFGSIGQQLMAASAPVVIASNQSAIPVSQSGTWNIGTVTTLTSITNPIAATQSGTWNITNISGTVSLPTGAATESTLTNVLTTTAFQARINTLGQKTMANSTPVVLASDQTVIPVSQSGTWNIGTVTTLTSITNAVTVSQATASSLNAQVVGTAASGASKSGNPVQVGAVYNATQPTVSTGQMVEAQATNRGARIVATGVDNFNINNISGTVSLPTGAATASNQTDGSQKTIILDGSGNTISSSGNALNENLVRWGSVAVTAAQALSTGLSAPTAPPIEAFMVGKSATGAATYDPATLGSVYNLNSSYNNTEYVIGVNLRKVNVSGAVEIGIPTNPVYTQDPNYYSVKSLQDVSYLTQQEMRFAAAMSCGVGYGGYGYGNYGYEFVF